MPSEWPKVAFEDLLNGGTRNGVYKPKKFHGTGVKIVNMGELFAHSRLRPVSMKRLELTDSELRKTSLQSYDLLFARRSLVAEGAGKCSIVLEVDEPTTFESSIIRARVDPNAADPLYLYYFFNSPDGRYLLGTIRRQVAVAGITGSDLVKLEIPNPPLNFQRRIASILGSLDDKIELNRRMNRTLERMAQALFKSWFIDFDPVRAKAAPGNSEPSGGAGGLPDHLAALFPDRLVNSELGEIPEGWEVKAIGDAVRCVGGATPSTKNPEYWEGGIHPFVTPRDMSRIDCPVVLTSERKITDAGVEQISSRQLPVGTVILSSRAPIGYLAITAVPVSVNQGAIAMICDQGLPNVFVLHWTEANMEVIKSRAGGTTFAEISKRAFRPIPVLVPPEPVLKAFMEHAGPMHNRIEANARQNRRLVALRDTLLPKLLSGEFEVPEAEAAIEEVA